MAKTKRELPSFEGLLKDKLAREGWGGFGVPDTALGKISGSKKSFLARRRTDANSKLLVNVNGTVFVVIDGIAYGYTSDTVFRSVHYRCYEVCSGRCPPRPGHADICTCVERCPRIFDFDAFADIETSIMDPLCSLRISPVNGAVYLIRSGVRHGITSARAFDNYQFDWDDVKAWDVSRELWDSLVEGTLLVEETGGRFD